MSYQQGLGVAGAVVGGVIGYFAGSPMLGAQIGMMAGQAGGAALDAGTAKPLEGPRISDLTVTAATYGLQIPRVWGVVRLAGNMIWSTGIVEKSKVTGGKGADNSGKGPRINEYSYYASFAVGLCVQADAALRIWADAKLVYDATGSGEDLGVKGLRFRFYQGTEDQMPDPAIVAALGDDAPAHRGLCYIVFEDVPLEPFGNRVPTVNVEVAASAGDVPVLRAHTAITGGWAEGYDSDDGSVDWGRKLAYRKVVWPTTGIAVVDVVTGKEIAEVGIADLVAGLDLSADGLGGGVDIAPTATVGRVGGAVDGGPVFWQLMANPNSPLIRADPVTLRPTGSFGVRSSGAINTQVSWVNATNIRVVTVPAATGPRTLVCGATSAHGLKIIDGATMKYLFGAQYYRDPDTGTLTEVNHRILPNWSSPLGARSFIVPGAVRTTPTAGGPPLGERDVWFWNGPRETATGPGLRWDCWRVIVAATAAASDTDGALVANGVSHALMGSLRAEDIDPAWEWFDPLLCEHDQTDDTFILVVLRALLPDDRRVIKWSPAEGVLWNVPALARPNGRGSYGLSRIDDNYYGYGGATPDFWHVIDTRTGATVFADEVADSGQTTLQAWDSRSASSLSVYQRVFLLRQSADGAPLASVVRDLCVASGLTDDDLDVSALSGSVRGFVAGIEPTRQALETLAAAYLFDAPEAGDVLRFQHRGGTAVATIGYDELVRPQEGTAALAVRRRQEVEIPRRVTVRYRNAEQDQQTGVMSWARAISPTPLVDSLDETTIDLGLVLTPSEAKAIAKRLLFAAWAERDSYEDFGLTASRLALEAADPVVLTMRDGSTVRARIERLSIGADYSIRLRAVAESAAAYAMTAIGDGGSGVPVQTIPAPYLSRLLWPELPLLADADDLGGAALRGYALVGGYPGQSFLGASLYYSAGDDSWSGIAAFLGAATWGTVLAAPGVPASPWATDRAGVLRVSLQSGASRLATVTRAQMLNGANRAAIITAAGEVEVLHFQDATPEADGSFTLTTLLRGCRGSDWAIGLHAPGDTFVLLSDAEMRPLALGLADLNVLRYTRTVGRFDLFDTAAQGARTARGEAERPWSPVHVSGTRDGSGNLAIAWQRRTRIGGYLAWARDDLTPPLGEASEAYEVDILDGAGAVVRTITGLIGPACAYSAADQTTDFGTPQAAVDVAVYQVSAAVGRGRARAATV